MCEKEKYFIWAGLFLQGFVLYKSIHFNLYIAGVSRNPKLAMRTCSLVINQRKMTDSRTVCDGLLRRESRYEY